MDHSDEVGRDVASLGRKDEFLQPILQRTVFRQAAEQAHRHVGVRVDEAGHEKRAVGVDHFPGIIGGG